jgi:imidazolonepropionase-like amidohydrolase
MRGIYMLLKNGKILTMEGSAFIGDVAVENGKIVGVGTNLNIKDTQVIDVTGCVVMPGIVDAHCHVGMWEDGMGKEGADGNEMTNPVTPQMRAIDGINPFDPCFDEACAAGITCAVTGPGSANVIGGQFVAMKTHGRSIEDMILKQPVAMKAATGENPKRVYSEQKATPSTRMATAAILRQALTDAQEYAKKLELGKDDPSKLPAKDLGKEAMLSVLRRELTLKVHAHRRDDILTALRIAKEFNIKVTIEHCTEGYMIADILKEQLRELNAGIIIGPLLSERSKIELKNLTFKAPAILYEAGVTFAMMTDHPVIPLQYLPVCAALAVREGLPEEEALKSITINAAKITGIDDRVGSIKVGKDADIAVFSGDPLDFRTRCVMTIINGEIVHDERVK